jgi:hypothetical protein
MKIKMNVKFIDTYGDYEIVQSIDLEETFFVTCHLWAEAGPFNTIEQARVIFDELKN